MNWKVKLLVQKLLDTLPEAIGTKMHLPMQRLFGNIGRMDSNNRHKLIQRGIVNTVKFLQEKMMFNFNGCKILEVGTGWHGGDILLFHILGASKIYTCDITKNLNESIVMDMLKSIGNQLNIISQECNVEISSLEKRYKRIASSTNLSQLLTTANIKYFAPIKLYEINLPSSSFDLFYSRSVLQRIPPNHLAKYLKKAHKALKPEGYSYHIIHHSDHNARHDKELGSLDYLRYSDGIYNAIQSKKYNYQNRMRHLEFLQLFEATGFENVFEQTIGREPKSVKDLSLAPRFKALPIEDVLITRTQLVSRRSVK